MIYSKRNLANMGKLAVIGAGKWGKALFDAFSSKSDDILITSRTPRDIKGFVSLDEALKCEYLVISISTQEISSWLEANYINYGQKVLVASKGIEANSGRFLNEIYGKYIDQNNIGFISGPSFASEVSLGLPTALVINSSSKEFYEEFAPFFPNFIKTYYSDDVVGSEIAGAYKNVLAIASGICDGLKLGNNARASLISRGLVEMHRFGEYFGAKDDTFFGLSGAGDLFLSASSTMSRNYRVGLGLAGGKNIDVIVQELGEVAEGVKTAEAIYKISSEKNIYTPIANEVKFIIEGKNPKQSLKDLLSR
jgi:glycerol-3-phosphate dehydrogenase (NAD(P)+)